MKVRIVHAGGPSWSARVENVETGEVLDGVVAVRWEIADPRQDAPRCVIELRGVAVELEADADLLVRLPQWHRSEP